MARYRGRLATSETASQVAADTTSENKEQAASITTPDPEIDDFIKQHPIAWAIFARCDELILMARELPINSSERKQLERRYQKLYGYVDPRLYASSTEKQEEFLRQFEMSLLAGEIRWQGRLTTWEDRKWIMNDLAKKIATKPVGNPVKYRNKVTEAVEMKHLNPDLTWSKIVDELHLQITVEDLKRQINILKKLLLKEGIARPVEPNNT